MYCVEMHYWTELRANLEMANERSDCVRKQFQSAIRRNTEAFSCSVNHKVGSTLDYGTSDCASVKQQSTKCAPVKPKPAVVADESI